MEKIVLVDGNNLLFRSYYATAYNGNFMQNSKGFPTNAIFGFNNMINKIILEEKPVYMVVAFDKGKTFRHKEYSEYKGGRMEVPDELKKQFPVAFDLLDAMGICHLELDNYEADDIIGTFSQFCNTNDYEGIIISSDKDLLQLISKNVDMKLLKSKDYIRYNEKTFEEDFGIKPIRVIDLKSLMGDASDNIPGVKGIGEKTAIKLLKEYNTLDGIYENIDYIKGALKEKLISDKENAYLSYHLATIVKDAPIEIDLKQIKYKDKNHQKLNDLYEELEFYSFLKKEKKIEPIPLNFKTITSIDEIKVDGDCAIYLEILGHNYHSAEILGMAVYNEKDNFFIPFSILKENPSFLKENIKYTYDLKKIIVSLRKQNISLENVTFDTMIASYLLDYNIKEDIAYLANELDYDIPFYDSVYGKTKITKPEEDKIVYGAMMKAKFIYESKDFFLKKIEEEHLHDLFYNIEMKLSHVLADMEYTGITVDKTVLEERKKEVDQKIKEIETEIYELSGVEFNISSPKQLADVLFKKMNIPYPIKKKENLSTSVDILNKLKDIHPIINKILDYRMYTKLKATYIDGILNLIYEDGKVHTIYTQTLTRTGRLSSIEPNLQNIPTRYEEGKLIRKAFLPSKNNILLSSDYSQIELRVLSSMANVTSLIEAFKEDKDIHAKTASDIFHIPLGFVGKKERRIAKAVNFGIIYGISSFGLSENVGITPTEAKNFIDTYFQTYPGIKEYMDKTIKQAYLDGYVKTLMNRKRLLPELKNKNALIRHQGERMALNTPIQGTSADIIKKAMIDIYEEINKQHLKSKMLIQVHDELIFDVFIEEKEILTQIVREKMENAYSLLVPLKVDIEYGTNWYDTK